MDAAHTPADGGGGNSGAGDASTAVSAAAAAVPAIAGMPAASASAAGGATPGAAAAAAVTSPSKSGKGKSGKGKTVGGGSKDPPPTAAELARMEAERIEAARVAAAKAAIDDMPHQTMIQSRLADIRARNAALKETLSSVQSALSTSESDSSDVLRYLEHEVRRKDLATKSLTRDIRALYQAQLKEKDEAGAKYEAQVAELERTFSSKEGELLALNRSLHQEVADLSLFARIRGELQSELDKTRALVVRHEKRHALQMQDLEHKFVLARQKLLAEAQARMSDNRRAYKEEVGRELDVESRAIARENERLRKEGAFHQTLVDKLQANNAELRSILADLEAQQSESDAREQECAQNALQESKLRAELKNKHALLERSLAKVRQKRAESQKLRRAATAPAPSPSSSDPAQRAAALALLAPERALQNELDKLRALSLHRSRENLALESHLSSLQSSRTDVEVLFLECLALVRHEVAERRRKSYERQVQQWREAVRQVEESMCPPRLRSPSSKSSHSQALANTQQLRHPSLPPPTKPVMDADKIRVRDLSLGERERVLQLLFERMNEQSATAARAHAANSGANSRASSALSLYAGSPSASHSSTSLVPSRPKSSALVRSRPSSRPHSSTRVAPQQQNLPHSGTRGAGGGGGGRAGTGLLLSSADLHPSQLVQMGEKAAAALLASNGHKKAGKQRRASEEKDAPFFPPRGDTPNELL